MRNWGQTLLLVVQVQLVAGAFGCEVPNPAYDGRATADPGSISSPDIGSSTPDFRTSTPDAVTRIDAAVVDAPLAIVPVPDANVLPSLAQGLVAHIAADEGTGSMLADKTGGPNLTAQQSFSWVPGRSGAANNFAIRFGQSGWATTSPSGASQELMAVTSAMSAGVWIKWDRPRMADEALSGKVGRAWYLRLGTIGFPRLCLSMETTAGTVVVCSYTDIALNLWTHVAFTWDGTSIKIFIKGVEDQEARRQIAGTLKTYPDKEFVIGAIGNGGDSFEGAMSDFRIYNRALTNQEVAALAR